MPQANLPQFKKLTTLLDEEVYYEIEKSKPELRLSLPIQIGYFIWQYAKLHMLQFFYDFFDKFFDRAYFQYCEMDTDSAYLAVSVPSLTDVIKPYMLPTCTNVLEEYCHNEIVEADADLHWFPRTCTKHVKFDKRTPGLFKLEKWEQHFVDISQGRVRPDHKGRYIVGSEARWRLSTVTAQDTPNGDSYCTNDRNRYK